MSKKIPIKVSESSLDGMISDLLDPDLQLKLAREAAGEYIDVEQPFDAGNTFALAGQFAPLPVWLRRFVFRILKAQEIAVYLYICSFVQKPQVAWVSLREMQRDFGLTNRHQLIRAISELSRLGFLLRKKGRVAKSRTEHDRNVFQRPSLAYTLLTLLEQGAIDAYFNPTQRGAGRAGRGKAPVAQNKAFGRGFLSGLDDVLDPETVKRYLNTRDSEKTDMLKAVFHAKVESLRTTAIPIPPDKSDVKP